MRSLEVVITCDPVQEYDLTSILLDKRTLNLFAYAWKDSAKLLLLSRRVITVGHVTLYF